MKSELHVGILTLTLALMPLARAQVVPVNGLVAYYPLNGNANDVVGSNHGTVVGATPASDRFGQANRAYAFNGNAYIRCPDTGLPSGNNPRTVCLWVNVDSFMGTITYPFGYGTISPASSFYGTVNSLYYPKPALGLGKVNDTENPRWPNVGLNTWYHVAMTYGNSTAKLFINGVIVGEAPRTYATALTGSFFIGGNMDAPNSTVTFSGRISDVRVYDRAVSASEVEQIYRYESVPRPLQAPVLYFTDVVDHSGSAGLIRRANVDGSGLVTLRTGVQHPRAIALDVAGGMMYWGEIGILRANLDGSGVAQSVVATGATVSGIALDLAAGKIYWTGGNLDPRLMRANLDGTAQETLVSSGMVSPVGLALDTLRRKIYWTDLEGTRNGRGSLHRSNMDGSNPETLLQGIDEANGLAIDVAAGKVYWTELVTHRIQRANLDGTGVEDIVTGLDNPTTICLDPNQGTLYWTDSEWTGQVNRISKASLDGKNVQVIVSGVGFPFGIAVAPVDAPVVNLVKAVKPSFAGLQVGMRYQLQTSVDLKVWSNEGVSFVATSTRMTYPQYWDVENWNRLQFRLLALP